MHFITLPMYWYMEIWPRRKPWRKTHVVFCGGSAPFGNKRLTYIPDLSHWWNNVTNNEHKISLSSFNDKQPRGSILSEMQQNGLQLQVLLLPTTPIRSTNHDYMLGMAPSQQQWARMIITVLGSGILTFICLWPTGRGPHLKYRLI